MITEEYERGLRDSSMAIASGKPKLYWGARSSWGMFLVEQMEERFGVTIEVLSCFTDPQRQSYEKGYNEMTVEFIENKFGAGSYQSLVDDVDQFRLDRYRQQFPPSNDDSN